jgi:hypothetical protein
MTITRRHPTTALLIALLALVTTLLALTADPARADVGVEKASSHHGAPGATINLTLACGSDHGPCMQGIKDDPPASFGVSLVRSKEAPQRRTCGDGPACTPTPLGPPHKAPFTFLGRAVPPPGGNDPAGGDPPRYLLRFTVPDLTPGTYTYEIWCGVCVEGKRGALIGVPSARLWRLVVRPPAAATQRATNLG